jgi:hypothetical protein
MAFLAQISPVETQPLLMPEATVEPLAEPDFSALEWSVIRLSRRDGMSTIRAPGPVRRLLNLLVGQRVNPQLANERLEALRRIAVLSWHFGFSVPGEDVADFLSAGFTPAQYELLVSSVQAPAKSNVHSISGEVLF